MEILTDVKLVLNDDVSIIVHFVSFYEVDYAFKRKLYLVLTIN